MAWRVPRFWFTTALALAVAALGGFDAARVRADCERKAAQNPPAKEDGDGKKDEKHSPKADLGSQPVLLIERSAKPVREAASTPDPKERLAAVWAVPQCKPDTRTFVRQVSDKVVSRLPVRGAGRCYQPHAPPIAIG